MEPNPPGDIRQAAVTNPPPPTVEFAPTEDECPALLREAEMLLSQGELWSAAAAARRAVRACPDSTDALSLLAGILSRQAAWQEAGEVYQTLTRHLPDDVNVWRGRLESSRKLGHAVLARLILEEALERHPEWAALLAEPSAGSFAPADDDAGRMRNGGRTVSVSSEADSENLFCVEGRSYGI